MIRLLALLAVSAAVSAQPSLDRLTVASDPETSAIPRFELTRGSQDLVLTVAASADDARVSGISITMAALDHFGGVARLEVPPVASAEAVIRYPLPRFLETGTYRLNVAVVDDQGYSRRWTADELVAEGLPDRFEVRVVGDLEAPSVASIDVLPIVDPARPQGTVRLTLNDPSGILAYRVVTVSPSGRRRVLAEAQSSVGVGPSHTFTASFDLSTGARLDGPAEQGWWSIAEVHTTDSNGTSQVLSGRDLVNLELQSRFAVGDAPPDPEPGPACGAPNPVASGAAVRLPASADVYDARGRRVARTAPDGTLATDGLGRGVYLTRPATPGERPCRFTVID